MESGGLGSGVESRGWELVVGLKVPCNVFSYFVVGLKVPCSSLWCFQLPCTWFESTL